MTILCHILRCSALIVVVLAIAFGAVIGQSDTTRVTKISQAKKAELKEIIAYDKTKTKLVPKRKKEQKEPQAKEEYIKPLDLGAGGILLKWLLYLGITLLVVVIIVLLFSNITIEKKLEAIAPLELEDVEDIETIDAKSGLQLALDAHNYREAVRMLFIQLLQELVIEESITWQPKKTNRDYLREMDTHPKINHFRNLVMAYDSVWYGSQEVDRIFFDHLRNDFERFYSTDNLKIDYAE